MSYHHTQDMGEKRTCDDCLRLIGVHNWSKRAAPHKCGCLVTLSGIPNRRLWCHCCPNHGGKR